MCAIKWEIIILPSFFIFVSFILDYLHRLQTHYWKKKKIRLFRKLSPNPHTLLLCNAFVYSVRDASWSFLWRNENKNKTRKKKRKNIEKKERRKTEESNIKIQRTLWICILDITSRLNKNLITIDNFGALCPCPL